jgi:hypothetical protein
MKSFFRLVLLALVLLVVALVSALTAMRLAIHGHEVAVPDLVGKSPAAARMIAEQSGLELTVERQYYSPTVPEGKILCNPPAGSQVRAAGGSVWPSLGCSVAIPNDRRASAPPITSDAAVWTSAPSPNAIARSAGQRKSGPGPPPSAAFRPENQSAGRHASATAKAFMPSFAGQPPVATQTVQDAGPVSVATTSRSEALRRWPHSQHDCVAESGGRREGLRWHRGVSSSVVLLS